MIGTWRGIRLGALLLLVALPAAAATVSGGFEGSNVVYIQEVSANNFTCKLVTPTMPTPASNLYARPGDHYHGWFMLKIEDAAGQNVTVTITNADWGPFNRADGKAVYTEEADPYALTTESTWQKITDGSYSSPNFTFNLTPSTNLAWVALGYPSVPTHTQNWISAQSASPLVSVETVATTSQGRPLNMLFVTDPNFPLAGKKGVVIYGHEHSQEPTGGWTCQGMVEFLTSGDPVAQDLVENVVFIVIPDVSPDGSAAGLDQDPDDGKMPQWRYNPAAIDRMMPGMIAPMTVHSTGVLNRLVDFVDGGGRIDFCFNIHQGGNDNFWGVYELADPNASNLDSFLRTYMPTSGAAWVPNARQGYSRGGWQNYLPTGPFSFRLLGRCWEEWRTIPMGYEIAHGAASNNFLTEVRGIKYFGEAIARAVYDYYGGFGQTITVLGPDGGESLPGGSATVTWNSTGPVGNVRIDYSADGGASWTNLVSSTANDGSQNVTLPAADSTSCLIRVSAAAARGVSDQSDDLFTIGTPPAGTITLTSPVGGELWDTNWMDTVSWTSSGSISNVRIDLTTDDGSSWRQLAYSVPVGDGSYRVNVPDTPSTQCRVRVSAVENNAVGDVSIGFFSIQTEPPWPTLTVTSPDGGETWPSGGNATVTWSTTGTVGNVGISLSTDEGASWTTLIDSTPDDGSQTVSVPAVESSSCLIWVFDARMDPWLNRPDADPLDVSDGLFSISSMVCVTDDDCDDNSICTGSETCQAGSCQPGTPLDCDDSNICTTDSCDPVLGCQTTDNNLPCDDGNVCTTGDACSGGSCQPGSGTLNCGDADPCTDDLCDAQSGCSNPPNTDPCDDGDACTMNDSCSQGTCTGAPQDADGDTYIADNCGGDDCDDTDGSIHPNAAEVCDDSVDNDCDDLTDIDDPGCAPCIADADCDDNNLCNGTETCQANSCTPGAALNCDDGNVCTTNSCDPVQGCQTTDNNLPCDDGDTCTTGDVCSNGACLGTTPAEVCDDGIDNDCDGDTDADDSECAGDSDGDGLPDAWEEHWFGDLSEDAAGDPDSDGLNNGEEYENGTDPTREDTDGDGHRDADEISAGTDPLDPSSHPEDKVGGGCGCSVSSPGSSQGGGYPGSSAGWILLGLFLMALRRR